MDIPRKLNASAWNDKFEELKQYKSQHGHCNVPRKYDKNQPLAYWVRNQRTQFKLTKLSEERINVLNTIGFNWRGVPIDEKNWNDKFEELKQYKSQHGDCNVPRKYDKNQPLGTWVRKQRFQFKQSKLSEECINRLNAIGFNWGVSIDDIWTNKFEDLKQYKSQHGDCNVPARYDKNQPLAYWVQTQRTQYKQSKMSEERINMMNSIGFNWGVSIDKKSWNDKFEELKLYKSQHGDCNVPQKYDKNQPLSYWVRNQRSKFKQSKMSEERINMLNAIGFNLGVSKDKKNWNDKFEELKQYKFKHEDCNVPKNYDKNQPLANWVHRQRFQFKQSKMSEEHINMLNAIGFDWGVSYDKSWNDKFEQLKQYKSKHGDCDVPSKYDKNQPLATWVGFQRTLFKQSKMSEERINMLNDIGFDWGGSKAGIWTNKFEELKKYKSKHEDCNVPKNYDKNQPLAYWVQRQRTVFKQSKMSEERINMLNAIGFNWGVSNDKSWNDKFEELKQYKSKHGDCNVPSKYDKNQPLATWVRSQRTQFKLTKLLEERINMLNGIGFNWTAQYDSLWNDKFEELKLYKSKHGDCNVPVKYDENQPLASWVHYQRSRYKHSKMSEEHIAMLNGIGFSWTASKRMNETRQLKNHEQRAIETSYLDSKEKETTTYQDSKEEKEHAVGKEINTEQDDSVIEEIHEQIACTTTKEKGDMPSKRSLQDSIQVLCKISLMFQEQKDAIHADMKRRKLGNSA